MINRLIERIGFPAYKTTKKRIQRRPSIGTQSEALEPRVLLAGDLAGGSALFYALSNSNAMMEMINGHAPVAAVAAVSTSDNSSATVASVDVSSVVSDLTVDDEVLFMSQTSSSPAPETEAEAEDGDIAIQIGSQTDLIYNSLTGELSVQTTIPITTLSIKSAAGIFDNLPAQNLGGTFDVDNNGEIFKLEPTGFNSLSFGRVARTGLSETDLQNDLDVSGSPLGGGSLSNKEAAFAISIIDASGSPTSELNVGEEFILRVLVDDDRAGPTASQTGVFSAYVDVNYNSSLATPVGSIQHASSYNTATSGTLSPGLIDEVGGIGGIDPLGPDNREVFRVRMRASQEGTLVFETNMADQVPNHDVLLYGQSAAVDPLRITFGKATVTVIDNSPKAPDLAAFAQDLTDAGVVFYGAAWCPHCTDQKELFEDGQAFLPFVEVTNPDKSPNQIGTDNNITTYPTWVFPDGTRLTGTQTLETLSQRSGVAIPEGRDPIIIGLDDVDVLGGSPLALPLDGYDPNNGPLTYTVTSDNPDLVSPELLSGNRSMTIDVSGYGQMTFQLYDNYAPRVTEQIAGLAEDGFYDGLTFHRIIDGFVIQGGDPLGNGTGGSDLPDFDDQFHVDLQHNQTGILSMAKSNDDTNNSQFFITEGDTRNLDFNHSIFGQLIEGESNREAISNVPVANERPNPSVIMNSVTVFEDTENALVMLKAPEGASGTANLTVTARDAEGHVYTQTIQVNVTPDTIDGGPFLNEIPEVTTAVNTPVTFTVTATDVEGDDVFFDAQAAGEEDYDLTIDSDTGEITITPPTDFVGELIANVGVRAVEQSDTGDAWDTQEFTVTVLPSAPTVDLLATSDTGVSDTDNITSAESLQFEVSNVQSGALVEIFANGVLIGAGTATDTSVIVTTDKLADIGNTSYLITATQTVSQLESEESASFTLNYLKLDLDDFTSTPPTTGAVDELISYDADHPDEGRNTFVYSLVGAPAGANIDPESGEFTWTPTASQTGVNNFQIVASDSAGNSATQDVSINVESDALVNYRLEVTDLNGTAIDAIPVGDKFLIRALVEDARPAVSGESRGVFSAYFDATYTSSLASVSGDLVFSEFFTGARLGNTDTAGLIDEAGALGGTEPLGSGEFLLWSIEMTADAAGTLTIAGDAADDLPAHQTTVFGLNDPVDSSELAFLGTTLEIVSMIFAADDTATVSEDSSNNIINVTANDVVVGNSQIEVTNTTSPSNGVASPSEDGTSVVYTPNANFVGTDTFTYSIFDGTDTATATVTVTVTNTNDPPSANDDVASMTENQASVTINVLSNDTISPDTGETLTVTAATDGSNGTVSVAANGQSVVYTPSNGFTGTDTFTYTISDGNGGTDTATVTVNVAVVNDPPTVGADSLSVDEDNVLTINVADLLANDSAGPANEANQTLSIVSVTSGTNGTAVLSGSTITFTPNADFNGTASFQYTVKDNAASLGQGTDEQASGTVTITVNSVNDNPIAVDDTASAQTQVGSITIDVLANDSTGPEANETLTIESVSTGSAGGSITIVNNQIRYTPADSFSGTETFTYTISDGNGGTDTATVSVSVTNFVEGGVVGRVYTDRNNNGSLDTDELGVQGIRLHLTGTDMNGAAVSKMVFTNSTGQFSLDEVLPGSYTLSQDATPFLIDGAESMTGSGEAAMGSNSFTFELTSDGLNGSEFNFAVRGLDPKFSIWDALASSSRDGAYAAVDSQGQLWAENLEGWDDYEITSVTMGSNGTSFVISALDDNGSPVSKTVDMNDRRLVRVIGQEGDAYLVRIVGSATEFFG